MSGLWDKANRAASAARLLREAGDYEGACNRGYYAMFNAARALLITKGVAPQSSKRHASVARAFSEQFVLNGPLDEELGRALRQAGEIRAVADYDDAPLGPERASAVIASMEAFMHAAGRLLGPSGEGER